MFQHSPIAKCNHWVVLRQQHDIFPASYTVGMNSPLHE